MKRRIQDYLFLLVILSVSCDTERPDIAEVESNVPDVSKNILATYDGGQISQSDFDQTFSQLPAAARNPGDDLTGWSERIVNQIFFNRILLEEMKASGFENDPLRMEAKRNLRRQLYSDHFLLVERQMATDITEAEIVSFYEKHRDAFVQPEVRTVYHIFKWASDTENLARAESELTELAARIENGENFGLLAEQHSESETRHRKGLLGNVERNSLPPLASDVVFSLDEGAVSQLVHANGGVHLFFNENTIKERIYSVEEVTANIQRVIALRRMREVLASAAGEVELMTENHFPPLVEVRKLLESGGSDAILFSIGTFELGIGQFSQIVSARRNTDSFLPLVKDPVMEIYEELKHREILFHSMLVARSENSNAYEDIEQIFQEQWQSVSLNEFQQKRLSDHVNSQDTLLANHFASNHDRFLSAPRVHLRRFSLPVDSSSAEKMAELELFKVDLEAGNTTLESVAAKLTGTVEDLGWFTPPQLRLKYPKAAQEAFGMEAGQFSFPVRSKLEIEMFEVLEKAEPEAVPFDTVRDAVAAHYIANYKQRVFATMLVEAKAERNFNFYPGHVGNQ